MHMYSLYVHTYKYVFIAYVSRFIENNNVKLILLWVKLHLIFGVFIFIFGEKKVELKALWSIEVSVSLCTI